MVQSVERAFAVLGALERGPAGVTEIGRRVALPKSTVARLLGTLERVGAVERVGESDWRIGTAAPRRSLVSLARPRLEQLVGELGEDAGLGVADGYEVLYVDQVEADQPVQLRDWTGTRAPMHTVPSGLVLLAEWPGEAVDAYVANGLVPLTRNTVTDGPTLRQRLREVREQGCAWGLEEFSDGIDSVAAPVRDARGLVVAAIHVHGPAYRFPPRGEEDRIATRVVAAAQAVGSSGIPVR